jgi:hypothetical protein
MFPDHFEEHAGPAPRRRGLREEALLPTPPPPLGAPQASAGCVCDLRRPACGGETRGVGECEDVESFAMPPTSGQFTHPNGDMELVFRTRRIL